MRQLAAHNLLYSCVQLMLWKVALLLAAFGLLICTLVCLPAPGTVAPAGLSADDTMLVHLRAPHAPTPETPAAPAPVLSLLHHSCCQFGPSLTAIPLVVLPVLLLLCLSSCLLLLQMNSKPLTPPPQFAHH